MQLLHRLLLLARQNRPRRPVRRQLSVRVRNDPVKVRLEFDEFRREDRIRPGVRDGTDDAEDAGGDFDRLEAGMVEFERDERAGGTVVSRGVGNEGRQDSLVNHM